MENPVEDEDALKRRADRIVLDHLRRYFDEVMVISFTIDANLNDIPLDEALPDDQSFMEILRRHVPAVPGVLPGFFEEPEPLDDESDDSEDSQASVESVQQSVVTFQNPGPGPAGAGTSGSNSVA